MSKCEVQIISYEYTDIIFSKWLFFLKKVFMEIKVVYLIFQYE